MVECPRHRPLVEPQLPSTTVTVPLLLASASPRRRELLERIGLVVEVHPADVDERAQDGEPPAAYVARIARAKAIAVARRSDLWVLAADTTVTLDGAILGKADTPEEATAMLRWLSGRTHQVLTAARRIYAAGHSNGAATASNPFGAILAGACVLAGPAVALFIFFQRQFISTNIGSSVKG